MIRNVIKINNYYLLVLWRVLLAYILYTICRALFIIFNYSILEPVTAGQLFRIFKGGLMFDTSAILYTNVLYLFLSFLPLPFVKSRIMQGILRWLYIIVNFLCIAMNLADTIYFKFSFRRTSMTFFSEFTGDVKFFKIFTESFILYWYIFLIGILFLVILILFSGKGRAADRLYDKNISNSVKYYNKKDYGRKFYLSQITALIITVPLFIIGVRGGVTRTIRPITISNAGDFTDKAIHTSAVLNTPFSLIRTIGKANYTYQNFYTSYQEMERYFTPMHNISGGVPSNINNVIKTTGESAMGKNIVILILESFGAENMSFLNENLDKCYTPFLDSLRKEGLLCTNAFANGRKSIDAVPSILISLPSMINSFAVTPYSTDYTFGLPKILDSLGYYTVFFHGAPNNSMGIRAVSRLCGVEHYVGKDEFNDNSKFDGAWGIWDNDFLQFVSDRMDELPQPFFANIFTLSSHHPFKVPDEFKDVLPDGERPLQKVTAYADMAIRNFFNSIKNKEWFKNTVFVITPDHSIVQGLYPEYSTTIGNTRIPIIYYSPDYIEPGEYDQTTQQLDIMPTILGLIGYDKPYFAFGRDLNSENQVPFAINYTEGQFQLVRRDTLLFRNDKEITAVYNLDKDPLLKDNLLESLPGLEGSPLLEAQDNFFKSLLQQYINRLIDNKLTVESNQWERLGEPELK